LRRCKIEAITNPKVVIAGHDEPESGQKKYPTLEEVCKPHGTYNMTDGRWDSV
jgi:hypothetical protein